MKEPKDRDEYTLPGERAMRLSRLREAIGRVSAGLVLPPGLAWAGCNVIIGGCITGIYIGYKPWMDEVLVLFPRRKKCRNQYCRVCGTDTATKDQRGRL